ncbi:FAD-dependent oxidoreductase [Cellulophaga sp. HaHaR_3_176]|uniref:flavin monoamine oxidase family protein n=1 Tax=Cellulophaga sp. HaHaR_3_176 TaxID=1942464 RepID=UPI001C1FB0B8|nr:FAD-dependent oxidoreductase [Cellulophaga sp. HaHaR_3_176]QWX83530.1 FAD-dependent oxidoreductase [Cellulophaga sp. HaHaR_3_176]
MISLTTKYIIIGAGLSGLTTAFQLNKSGERDFMVLDARAKIGGRILTNNQIDFGATWFQNHHTNVAAMLRELKVEKFPQYSKGRSVLVYSTMAPEHYFQNDPNAPSAYRVAGGSVTLINELAAPFNNQIKTNTTVLAIEDINDGVKITTSNGIYKADKVIITIPPRIATLINFTPELPNNLTEIMKNTHTWMSNAIKVGLKFRNPFWKDKNLSGTIIGQVGAVTELYDHSNIKNSEFGLMGFVNEALRDLSSEDRKTKILEYLTKYLGEEIMEYTSYDEKDWSQDKNTSSDNIKSIYMSPSYGNPMFSDYYLNGKVLFSGAETSPVHGGYMDGAIYSGKLAAKKLKSI